MLKKDKAPQGQTLSGHFAGCHVFSLNVRWHVPEPCQLLEKVSCEIIVTQMIVQQSLINTEWFNKIIH